VTAGVRWSMPHVCPEVMRPARGYGYGEQVTDRARPHALLLAMVTLVVVVALDLQCMSTEGMPCSTTRCSSTDPGG
jgi:hypothetical protein